VLLWIFETLGPVNQDGLALINLIGHRLAYISDKGRRNTIKREEEHDHFARDSKGLYNQYAQTNYRRVSLTSRGPIIWNNIPNDICDLLTFVQFKLAWRKYMTYVEQ